MQGLKRVHMVGIGGIGMSALAQLYQGRGIFVTGSDREASPVTAMLEGQGIGVSIGSDGRTLPDGIDLLVYSDAVPADNPERRHARQMRIPERSYFEALGAVSKEMTTIAVAGTHGKTTTTAMLAVILAAAGRDPTAVVGSIVRDFPSNAGGSNFRAGGDLFVVEACEYRDHVLQFHPRMLVITNIELDHTDYFPDLAALQETFRKAVMNVPEDGVIVTDPSNPAIAPILANVKTRVVDYTQESAPTLSQIGEFNRQNARAAKAAAKAAFPDIAEATIDAALQQFRGSWRRFEYKGETLKGALVYDDYAHHPTAIRATIEAAREQFPGKRIVVAFHPHLYSRTKSLLADFASALARADESIIAPIYAAREQPDPSVSHTVLAEAVRAQGGTSVACDSFNEIRDRLKECGDDTLVILMGAGDIYRVAAQIVAE